jgi:phospholipase/carboxylesterase
MLTGPKREAQSGEADALVVFVHGYGADGNDLLGIGDALAPYLPDVAFVAPNAPDPCTNNPMGYQWFPIPWLDGSSEEDAQAGADRAFQMFDAYLDNLSAQEGIAADRIVLFGFSQGTMMSLHVGLRREAQLAGIVGFSGRLLRPERLAEEIKSLPPVLLVHGDMDDVVPPASMPEAAQALQAAGVRVFSHVSQGMGHGIGQDGLGLALELIRQVLGIQDDEAPAEDEQNEDDLAE